MALILSIEALDRQLRISQDTLLADIVTAHAHRRLHNPMIPSAQPQTIPRIPPTPSIVPFVGPMVVLVKRVAVRPRAVIRAMHDANVQGPEDGNTSADYGGEHFGGGPEKHRDGVVDVLGLGGERLELVGADYGADAGAASEVS